MHLISHPLCPYVQRAVITLSEKGVRFGRTDIDLADKPDWFLRLSPLGKTPVLVADGTPIFESMAILEFLEETQPNSLLPPDPYDRAQDRGWIEFASAMLNDIAGLYNARTGADFTAKISTLRERVTRLETAIGDGLFFRGAGFGLVDAAFAPVFRYLDVFDRSFSHPVFEGAVKLAAWRRALSRRPSVVDAVPRDYKGRLIAFLGKRKSYMATLIGLNAPSQFSVVSGST